MIRADAKLAIARIPLDRINVTEHQARYPERALHYVHLMQAHPDDDPGLVCLKPLGGIGDRYELLDGHHRFCAAILTGRPNILALVIDESHLD